MYNLIFYIMGFLTGACISAIVTKLIIDYVYYQNLLIENKRISDILIRKNNELQEVKLLQEKNAWEQIEKELFR